MTIYTFPAKPGLRSSCSVWSGVPGSWDGCGRFRVGPEQLGRPKLCLLTLSLSARACASSLRRRRGFIQIVSPKLFLTRHFRAAYLLLDSKHETRLDIKYTSATNLALTLFPQPLLALRSHESQASSRYKSNPDHPAIRPLPFRNTHSQHGLKEQHNHPTSLPPVSTPY